MDFLKLLLNTLLVFHIFHFSTSSIDTITANHSIKDGDVIVSKQKMFALGFFSPGKSLKRYVGIWYHQISGYQIPEQTVVWVANRDRPISGKTGLLSINTHGNLVLYETNQSTVPVWSTNVSFTLNTVAQLLDSGNLVLRLVENRFIILWESFNYPTDTLLPLMKLGLDRKTGLNRILISWKSWDDPGSGNYSFRIDPTAFPQLLLWKRFVKWWRPGTWTGRRWTGVPEAAPDIMSDFTFLNNQDEVCYLYNLPNPPSIERAVVTESRFLQRLKWSNRENKWYEYWQAPNNLPCDYYGHCGANSSCNSDNSDEFKCTCLPGYEPKYQQEWNFRNGSGGCTRKRGTTTCQTGEGFVKVASLKVPDTRVTLLDESLDLQACENKCLSNCSCVAYAIAYPDINAGLGCLTYHGEMMDTRSYVGAGQDLYVRVDAQELAWSPRNGSIGRKTMVVIVVASSFAMLFMIVVATWFFRRKRRETARPSQISLSFTADSSNLDESFSRKEKDSPLFDLRTIAAATKSFSFENKLGEGGFGPVYKGQLSDGQQIAVKRLSKHSGQGISEFKNEVLLIAKLQHRNLVKLLGYCIEKGEKMLIYEFMPNKSLDYFIFANQSIKQLLDWRMRFDIILGIARGILYLHQDSRLKIIHRDLKASNILLDKEMKPKISDFGTAKIFGEDESQANTKRVVGTYGYMSPEYLSEGLFSTKSDIFSFGVIVLEIISGRRNRGLFQDDPSSYLIQYTWELWRDGKAMEIVDPCIVVDSLSTNEVLRCIQIGLLCVQDKAKDRPSLSTIISMLTNEITLSSPKKPTFVIWKNEPDSSVTGIKCSINEATITTLDAR